MPTINISGAQRANLPTSIVVTPSVVTRIKGTKLMTTAGTPIALARDGVHKMRWYQTITFVNKMIAAGVFTTTASPAISSFVSSVGSDATVVANDTEVVTVTGTGFLPGVQVDLSLASAPATIRALSAVTRVSNTSLTFKVPVGTPAAAYKIRVTVAGLATLSSTNLTVS
jgi:hypothetical protein